MVGLREWFWHDGEWKNWNRDPKTKCPRCRKTIRFHESHVCADNKAALKRAAGAEAALCDKEGGCEK